MANFKPRTLIKPWNALLVSAAMFLICSPFSTGTLDLHFHDTYFVIANAQVAIVVSVFLFLLGLVYYFCRSLLPYRILSWLHIITTVFSLVLCFVPIKYEGIVADPKRYYDYNSGASLHAFSSLNTFITVAVFAAFFGQVLFLINFIIGILFKITGRT